MREEGHMRSRFLSIVVACLAILISPEVYGRDIPGNQRSKTKLPIADEWTVDQFEKARESDWYKVTLKRNRNYTISGRVDTGGLTVNLRNATGKILKTVMDGNTMTLGFEFHAIQSGSYYIEYKQNGVFTPGTKYYAATSTDCLGIITTRCFLTIDQAQNGSVAFDGDSDWSKLSLSKNIRYKITEASALAPFNLAVYDSAGTKAAESTTGTAMLLFTPTVTGTYFVSVSLEHSAPQKYVILVAPDATTEPPQAKIAKLAEINGNIFDASESAILYLSASDGALHVFNYQKESDQIVGDISPLRPRYGFLFPGGAIFYAQGASYLQNVLFEYVDDKMQQLGQLNSAQSLRVTGDYGIWSGSYSGDPGSTILPPSLYRVRFSTGEVSRILFSPGETGNIENDVSADGTVTFWSSIGYSGPGDMTTDYNVFQYDGARLTRVSNFSPDFSIYPRSDGRLVVFTREEVCCSTTFSDLLLYVAGRFETLRTTSPPMRAEPDADYRVSGGHVAFRSPAGELVLRNPDGTIRATGLSVTMIIALSLNGDVVFGTASGPRILFADGVLNALPADINAASYAGGKWLIHSDIVLYSILSKTPGMHVKGNRAKPGPVAKTPPLSKQNVTSLQRNETGGRSAPQGDGVTDMIRWGRSVR
jgi:hypothetical protein